MLDWALRQVGDDDPVAAYGLGNLLYDKRRHRDAIAAWEVAEESDIPQVSRNLGIARWNVHRDGEGARRSYLQALSLDTIFPPFMNRWLSRGKGEANEPYNATLITAAIAPGIPYSQ